jgi:hypothetical protein
LTAVVVGTLCVLATTACGGTPESSQGCGLYVHYPSEQAAADDADLVASGALDAAPTTSTDDQWVIPVRLHDVKIGDAQMSGSVVRVGFDASCGDPVPSFPPKDDDSGARVIVFLVGSSAEGWRLLTPSQGIVPFTQEVFDAIEPKNT